MDNLIAREWNGQKIRQLKNGYVSATDMCKVGDKRFADFYKTQRTKDYLNFKANRLNMNVEAVMSKFVTDTSSEFQALVIIVQGGKPDEQGTWVHPKVAFRLAQWISIPFADQVDEWIEELMTTGKVELQQHPERDNLDVLGDVIENLKYQRDLLKAQQKQITENALDIVDVQNDVDDLKTKINNALSNPSTLDKQKFTIDQFSRMQNMIGSVGDHISAGKKLTKLCGILAIDFNNNFNGKSNEYPYWLLDAIFSTIADYQVSFEVLIKKYLVYWTGS